MSAVVAMIHPAREQLHVLVEGALHVFDEHGHHVVNLAKMGCSRASCLNAHERNGWVVLPAPGDVTSPRDLPRDQRP